MILRDVRENFKVNYCTINNLRHATWPSGILYTEMEENLLAAISKQW